MRKTNCKSDLHSVVTHEVGNRILSFLLPSEICKLASSNSILWSYFHGAIDSANSYGNIWWCDRCLQHLLAAIPCTVYEIFASSWMQLYCTLRNKFKCQIATRIGNSPLSWISIKNMEELEEACLRRFFCQCDYYCHQIRKIFTIRVQVFRETEGQLTSFPTCTIGTDKNIRKKKLISQPVLETDITNYVAHKRNLPFNSEVYTANINESLWGRLSREQRILLHCYSAQRVVTDLFRSKNITARHLFLSNPIDIISFCYGVLFYGLRTKKYFTSESEHRLIEFIASMVNGNFSEELQDIKFEEILTDAISRLEQEQNIVSRITMTVLVSDTDISFNQGGVDYSQETFTLVLFG